MAALLNILLPSSSISTSTGLNMRNFFLLLFHSASIAPDRREIKATKLLTVERPTSHKERGATVYLFFLFSFCAITNQTEKKERKENHISRLHMGLLAEWILYIVAASFLSPPKVLSAGLTIRCNGVRWSKPIALLLTQSDPAAFFSPHAGCCSVPGIDSRRHGSFLSIEERRKISYFLN